MTLTTPYQAFDLDVDSGSLTACEVQRGLRLFEDGATPTKCDAATAAAIAPFESMFDFGRIQRPYGWTHVLLVLYIPIGLVVMVARLLTMFTLAMIVPRFLSEKQMDWVGQHRISAYLTGTFVKYKDTHNWDRENPATVVVSNHISEGDIVAVRRVIPSYVLGYSFYQDMLLFRLLAGKFGFLFVPYVSRTQGGEQGRDQIREIIKSKLEAGDKPLLAFPEGGLTNGRKGLLQYHSFLFSLGQRVQPLAIQVSNHPFPVNINDDFCKFITNALWYLFLPWHIYTIQFLPVTQAGPNESALDFAQRVMKQTARALHQDATPFLYREKLAFVRFKKQQLEQQRAEAAQAQAQHHDQDDVPPLTPQ